MRVGVRRAALCGAAMGRALLDPMDARACGRKMRGRGAARGGPLGEVLGARGCGGRHLRGSGERSSRWRRGRFDWRPKSSRQVRSAPSWRALASERERPRRRYEPRICCVLYVRVGALHDEGVVTGLACVCVCVRVIFSDISGVTLLWRASHSRRSRLSAFESNQRSPSARHTAASISTRVTQLVSSPSRGS